MTPTPKDILDFPPLEEHVIIQGWSMGNLCGSSSESMPSSPIGPCQRHGLNGIQYHEQNRYQEGYFRGRQPPDNEPECTCFGPTPEERFFIQRYPPPQVMNTTISKDLAEVTEESQLKAQELRQERIRLIRSKTKELTGKDLDMDGESPDMSDEDLTADEQVAQLFEADRLAGKHGNRLTPESRLQSVPTPVPISDLAPMPSNEEIFGKIDELRKQHASDIADFEKAQTLNKERTNQGLQEKLMARRHRRSRMQAHERETEEVLSQSRSNT